MGVGPPPPPVPGGRRGARPPRGDRPRRSGGVRHRRRPVARPGDPADTRLRGATTAHRVGRHAHRASSRTRRTTSPGFPSSSCGVSRPMRRQSCCARRSQHPSTPRCAPGWSTRPAATRSRSSSCPHPDPRSAGGLGSASATRPHCRARCHALRGAHPRLPAATQDLLLLAASDPTGDASLLWRAADLIGCSHDAIEPARGRRHRRGLDACAVPPPARPRGGGTRRHAEPAASCASGTRPGHGRTDRSRPARLALRARLHRTRRGLRAPARRLR